MRQKECCQEFKDIGYKFCPMCGIFIGACKGHRFEATKISKDEHRVREGEHKEEHPSYAQLSISRRSGMGDGRVTLYGSTIRHQNTISLQIKGSAKHYDNYHERYYGEGIPYIEIEMSQSQFAEAITSLNMGSGVPVTVRYLMGETIPFCEELTMRQKIDGNIKVTFKNIVHNIASNYKRIDELGVQKGPLKAKEKEELIGMCRSLIQDIESNMPFFKQTIDEVVDASVMQAKSEIDATMQHVITRLGMEKLGELTGNSNLLLED